MLRTMTTTMTTTATTITMMTTTITITTMTATTTKTGDATNGFDGLYGYKRPLGEYDDDNVCSGEEGGGVGGC